MFDAVLKVTLRIGFLFQVQDDYLDCFGEPEATGKVGTDIQDAKCTWLIVQALRKVSEPQRKILEQNCGVKSNNAANRVKEVYSELKLEQRFKEFEREAYQQSANLIKEMPLGLPKNTFFDILDTIYRRKK